MTKTITTAYILEELSVELCSQGVRIETARAFGVPVLLHVRYEPVSEKHDTAHVVVEKVTIERESGHLVLTDSGALDLDGGADVFAFIPRSQVEAIEENLLAQMAGDN